MTAHLTKQLGMAPGGEFRTAFRQVNRRPWDGRVAEKVMCHLGPESSWLSCRSG